MNKVELMGRLTRDPEVRYSQDGNNTCVARYTLAVKRRFMRNGEEDADFIRCIALGKKGEFAEKYLKRGVKIVVVGRLQSGRYDKEGQTHFTTDVVVEEQHFCGSSAAENRAEDSPDNGGQGFMDIPDDLDDEMPFR